jgi:hypothetical protein
VFVNYHPSVIVLVSLSAITDAKASGLPSDAAVTSPHLKLCLKRRERIKKENKFSS